MNLKYLQLNKQILLRSDLKQIVHNVHTYNEIYSLIYNFVKIKYINEVYHIFFYNSQKNRVSTTSNYLNSHFFL
jgi:hypothetical protein